MRKQQRISRTEIGTKLEAAVLDEVSQAGSAPTMDLIAISSAVQSGRSVTELFLNIFLKKYLDDISPFCATTDTLFWTSDNVCPGFLNQGGFLCLHACCLCTTDSSNPPLV